MVLKLGKLADGSGRLVGPGFHITLPRPFAQVVRIPTESIRTVTTDSFWQPELSVNPSQGDFDIRRNLTGDEFGYTLTGDANVLHSQWSLHYTIDDPEIFAFGFGSGYADDELDAHGGPGMMDELAQIDKIRRGDDPPIHLDAILRSELDHAIIKTSSRLTIDQTLRAEKETFRTEVEAELQRRVKDLALGVEIQGLDMVDSEPPPAVRDAFDAVINAGNESSTRIDNARTYAERTVNQARGDAARISAEAEAYKNRLVDEVSADADYFNKVKDQFAEHPEILYRTLLQDTVARSLKNVDQKFLLPEGKGNQELRISVSPEPRKPGEQRK